MLNFKKNIEEALANFEGVFTSFDIMKKYLVEFNDTPNSYEKLDEQSRQKVDHAVELLVQNARVTETRKMQQEHFGPTLAKLRQSADKIVKNLKEDHNFFICFIQLTVIFFQRRDIESENHHHDMIRESIEKTIKEIVPLL